MPTEPFNSVQDRRLTAKQREYLRRATVNCWRYCAIIAEHLTAHTGRTTTKHEVRDRLYSWLKGNHLIADCCNGLRSALEQVVTSKPWLQLVADTAPHPAPASATSTASTTSDARQPLRPRRASTAPAPAPTLPAPGSAQHYEDANNVRMAMWLINRVGSVEKALQAVQAAGAACTALYKPAAPVPGENAT